MIVFDEVFSILSINYSEFSIELSMVLVLVGIIVMFKCCNMIDFKNRLERKKDISGLESIL